MRNLDFSSWQGMLSTMLGLAIITLIGVGIRLLVMQRIQQRRERQNRQINERLRTLIAAYKTLGGSFTGNLDVDPSHLRDLKRASMALPAAADAALKKADEIPPFVGPIAEVKDPGGSDRSRRIRDAVEAALADIILLGTEEQVRLAAEAAKQMAEGYTVHTAALVVSLRNFIRDVLNLDSTPENITIPLQGPARPSGAKSKETGIGDRSGKTAVGSASTDGGGRSISAPHIEEGHHVEIGDSNQNN